VLVSHDPLQTSRPVRSLRRRGRGVLAASRAPWRPGGSRRGSPAARTAAFQLLTPERGQNPASPKRHRV